MHSSSSASGAVPMNGRMAWDISVTPSALVTMSLLLVVLLGFSFMAGVATGLSSAPIPQALQLESLFGESTEKSDAGTEETDQILPKEELRFLTNLKSEHTTGILSEQGQKAGPSAQKEVQPDPETPKEPQFEFVLRVAAFKAADKAQELVGKLQKEGLKARRTQTATKRGTWYYAQTVLRGSEEDLAHHQASLAALGFRDTMLISKTDLSKKRDSARKSPVQEKKTAQPAVQKKAEPRRTTSDASSNKSTSKAGSSRARKNDVR